MEYIIYDIEATCWKGSPPGMVQETIEIGAVKYNYYGDFLGEFSRFIKPQVNPELSLFCRQLTNIEQSSINRASNFESVIYDFMDWIDIEQPNFTLCSWGSFDQKQLKEECEIYDVEQDWLNNYINVKNQYKSYLRLPNAKGLNKALRNEGFEFSGIQHRAINDAKNLAKIVLKHVDEWQI